MIKLTKDKCFILVVMLCLVFVLLNSTTVALTQVEVQKQLIWLILHTMTPILMIILRK